MTDVQIDWGALDVREVYPQSVPDLFVGRPVILTGRSMAVGRRRLRFGAGGE